MVDIDERVLEAYNAESREIRVKADVTYPVGTSTATVTLTGEHIKSFKIKDSIKSGEVLGLGVASSKQLTLDTYMPDTPSDFTFIDATIVPYVGIVMGYTYDTETFTGDGTTTVFTLEGTVEGGAPTVTINGVDTFEYDYDDGVITFYTAPENGVEIKVNYNAVEDVEYEKLGVFFTDAITSADDYVTVEVTAFDAMYLVQKKFGNSYKTTTDYNYTSSFGVINNVCNLTGITTNIPSASSLHSREFTVDAPRVEYVDGEYIESSTKISAQKFFYLPRTDLTRSTTGTATINIYVYGNSSLTAPTVVYYKARGTDRYGTGTAVNSTIVQTVPEASRVMAVATVPLDREDLVFRVYTESTNTNCYMRIVYSYNRTNYVNGGLAFINPRSVDVPARQMLGYAAGFLGCNVAINRDGELVLKRLLNSTYEIPYERQYLGEFKKDSPNEQTISYVTTGTNGEGEHKGIITDNSTANGLVSGSHGLCFENNFFNTCSETYDNLPINQVRRMYYGQKLVSGSVKIPGIPTIESGDIVFVQDQNKFWWEMLVQEVELTISGGFSCTINGELTLDSSSNGEAERGSLHTSTSLLGATVARNIDQNGAMYEYVGHNKAFRTTINPPWDDNESGDNAGGTKTFRCEKSNVSGHNPTGYSDTFSVSNDGDVYVGHDITINGGINTSANNTRGERVFAVSSSGNYVYGYGAYANNYDSFLMGENIYLRVGGLRRLIIQTDTSTSFEIGYIAAQFPFDSDFVYRPTIVSSGGLVLSANNGQNALILEGKTLWLSVDGISQGAIGINSSGKVINVSSSAQKYKENITENLDDNLVPNQLYNLPIKQFNIKDEYKDMFVKTDTQIGIIADDVNEIYPNACMYGNDGEVEGWNERILVPAMLKLIQDQKKQIDELEQRVEQLEKEQ